MTSERRSIWRTLLLSATASIVVWLLAVAWAAWYLQRMVAEEYRTGARTTTDGDSIGLPLGALGIALAGILLIVNVAIVGILLWRRRWDQSASRAVI